MQPDLVSNAIGIGLFVGAYLLGSIPFGLVLTKLTGMGDIRNIGSGNIGATNVLRTGNKKLALLTLVLDGIKGGIAVWVGGTITHNYDVSILMGITAVLGHIYPVWLKFKGGKGVATAICVMLVAHEVVGIGMIITWLMVAYVTRFSSLAALVAFAGAPLYAWFMDDVTLFLYALPLSALIILKHRANISRLIEGAEPKIGGKKG